MQKHRLTVDLDAGTCRRDACEIVEVLPNELHYRDVLGAFHPLASARPFSGERFIVTGLHDDGAGAMAEALAELRRRGERLLSLADKFEQQQEHDHA